jgi:hypothetical protein
MMEPLESRRLLSGAVAPLGTTSADISLVNDPNIVLTLNDKQLASTSVLSFGPVGQKTKSITKKISLYDIQGSFPANFLGSDPSSNVSMATLPAGFTLSTKPGADAAHAFLLVTFKPSTAATTSGTITIPGPEDGSNSNISFNVRVSGGVQAQNLYQDPYIELSLTGQRLLKDYTLAFGQVAQGSGTLSKTISLYDSQGSFPLNFFSLNFGGGSLPSDFSVSTALGADSAHATLTVTFTPTTPGPAGGSIVIPVSDGGNFVIAFNVRATVLPTADVSVNRIDMARLPSAANSIHAINGNIHPKGLAHVQLLNDSTYTESGPVSINLYASLTPLIGDAIPADAILLGTGTNENITIKTGKMKPVLVHYAFPVLSETGKYNIIAVATAPTIIVASGAVYSSPILQPIQAPEINLSGIATQSPPFLTQKTARITVPISNSGTVRAKANVQFNIYIETPEDQTDPPSASSLLGTFNLNYSVGPDREAIRTLNLGQTVQAGDEIVAEITAVRVPATNTANNTTTLPDSFAVR